MTLPRMPVARSAADVWFGALASRPWFVAAVALPVVLVATLGAVVLDVVRLHAEHTRLSEGDRQGRAAPLPFVPSPADTQDTRGMSARLQARATLIQRLNTPWPTILDALERAKPPGVSLVLLDHDAQRGVLTLEARAEAARPLMAFAQALEWSPPFGAARLGALGAPGDVTIDPRVSMRLEVDVGQESGRGQSAPRSGGAR